MPLQIGIFGRGRLGSAIAAAAETAEDIDIAWQVGRDLPQELTPVDVAVEVSHADAVADRLAWARESGTDLVIGTTGWDPDLLSPAPYPGLLTPAPSAAQPTAEQPGAAAPANGILTAPNFSLTVALMRRISLALGRYAALTGADLAVSEVHHTRKADAPSGTALLLREALRAGSGQEDVQTSSLRLGAVVGRHDVHLNSSAESITLTHEAHSREIYGLGALTAARWLHGRRGIFTFDDLAAEVLDPLFSPEPQTTSVPA